MKTVWTVIAVHAGMARSDNVLMLYSAKRHYQETDATLLERDSWSSIMTPWFLFDIGER